MYRTHHVGSCVQAYKTHVRLAFSVFNLDTVMFPTSSYKYNEFSSSMTVVDVGSTDRVQLFEMDLEGTCRFKGPT
jgi:hypothetical protein